MKTLSTIRQVYQNIGRSSPQYLLLSALLALVKISIPFVNIFYLGYLTDAILAGHELLQLVLLCVGFLFMLYFSKTVSDGIEKGLTTMGNALNNEFELRLNHCITHMDYTYLENPKILDKRDRAMEGMKENDGVKLADINLNLVSIVSSIFVVGGTLYLIVTIHPLVLLVLFLTIAATLWIEKKLSDIELSSWKQWIPLNRRFRMVYDLMYNFKNAQDVRLYNTYAFFTNQASRYNVDSVTVMKNEGRITARYSILKRLLVMIQFVVVQLFVVNKALKGLITVGGYTVYINAANSFSENAMSIVQNIVQIRKSLLYMSEYFDFLELPTKEEQGAKAAPPSELHSIEFRDVSFRYPGSERNSLDHVNARFSLDEKLGIVGRNGAGKTTFIKLLLRFYEPTQGMILLDGKDIREYDYSGYLALFSAVFQDFNIYPIYIWENVVASNAYDERRLWNILEELNLKGKLSKCANGLETVASKQVDEEGIDFSTGEKQMLAMARAIYKPSAVLILDEPTASLDAKAETLLYQKYQELSQKKISFFISHRLASCMFCDNILVFDDGKIVQEGSHKQLLRDSDGLYARMFHLQAAQYQ